MSVYMGIETADLFFFISLLNIIVKHVFRLLL